MQSEQHEVTITTTDGTVYTFDEEVGAMTHWSRVDEVGNLSGGRLLMLCSANADALQVAVDNFNQRIKTEIFPIGAIPPIPSAKFGADWGLWGAGYPTVGEVFYVESDQYWWISTPVVSIEREVVDYKYGDDDGDDLRTNTIA